MPHQTWHLSAASMKTNILANKWVRCSWWSTVDLSFCDASSEVWSLVLLLLIIFLLLGANDSNSDYACHLFSKHLGPCRRPLDWSMAVQGGARCFHCSETKLKKATFTRHSAKHIFSLNHKGKLFESLVCKALFRFRRRGLAWSLRTSLASTWRETPQRRTALKNWKDCLCRSCSFGVIFPPKWIN